MPPDSIPTNDPWLGKSIRTLVPDCNEVEDRGEVRIPAGWRGRVDRIVHYDDQEPFYAVAWDDDPNAPGGAGNMGWSVWSASELRTEAELV